MKIVLVLSALLLSISIYSQKISGKVVNENNEVVSYCSVSLENINTSTITDINGNYSIEIPENAKKSDFIIFESNGYEDKKVTLQGITTDANIRLSKKTNAIQEINITGKKTKKDVLGAKSRPMLTFSKMFDQNVPTIEQGQIFNIYKWTKLNSYNFFIIPSSKFKEITLKLNIYSVKNNLPDESLLQENIIFKTNTTGWQTIDLEKYKLIYNDLDQLAITLQLVENVPQDNIDFVFGISAKKTLSNDLLFRYQSQGKWETSGGSFISNIDINYMKDKKESVSNSVSPTDNSPEDKMLMDYYQNKERAKKTVYGKNKSGKYIDLKNAKIYYEEYGSGEPLVMLHGNNGSISDFYNQIPDLAKQFKVIVLDTRGQGRSTDLSTEDYTYEEFSEDLLAVTKELNIKKFNIIGWSDGGITGLLFTINHPDLVNKLIVIGANTNPEGIEPKTLDIFKKQLEIKDAPNQRLIKLMVQHPHIETEQLKTIKNPVLVIAGSNDVIKEDHTKLINSSIPNSKLLIVPDASHYVPFEKPDILNKSIINFLKI
ncbi:oxidoreductase [Chryseobacterium sp. KBW03]|uniref:alpha/beta fold hydrolase n=1 Tax=Chryseobacterium sp. KBW03 TaxID=2153362 RepID=UPI000F5994C7|nr:alpha/beta hydrolase [Chryseobacterium sp. KBW03]RQO38220.1 oxidoreductase [Chryseobacterium sp. KBW03]